MSGPERKPSIRLPEMLQVLHHKTLLGHLALRGYPALEWDPEIIEPLLETLSSTDSEEGIGYTRLHFDGGNPALSAITKPIYTAAVLGYRGIGPVYSDDSVRHREYLDALQVQQGNARESFWCNTIDSPVKVLHLHLLRRAGGTYRTATFENRANEPAIGVVFFAPDTPPTAVHIDDLTHVAKSEGIEYYDDLRLLDRVRQAFGEEAIDVLSENSCMQIISALQAARKTLKSMSE